MKFGKHFYNSYQYYNKCMNSKEIIYIILATAILVASIGAIALLGAILAVI